MCVLMEVCFSLRFLVVFQPPAPPKHAPLFKFLEPDRYSKCAFFFLDIQLTLIWSDIKGGSTEELHF